MPVVDKLPVVTEQQHDAELRTLALSLPDEARTLIVRDQQSYDLASEKLGAIVDMRKQIIEHHAPMKAKAWEAHRAICTAESSLLTPVTEAEAIIKHAVGNYEMEQRRIREIADRQAREEAERIAMEAREREIEEAEQSGADAVEVAAITEAPMVIPRVVVQAPILAHRPAAGMSTSKTYKAHVVDIKKLARAVVDGVVPHTLIEPNMPGLNAMARAQKGILQIPGVSVIEDSTVRVGRTR